MDKIDVAIVGAGPCALSCAVEMAERGFRGKAVLLEEKAHVGGEGARSDGKFKTSEEFSTPRRRGLWDFAAQQQYHQRFLRMFMGTGVGYREEPSAADRDRQRKFYDVETARIASLHIPDFEIRRETGTTLHVGTDHLKEYVEGMIRMIGDRVRILCNHRVDNVHPNTDGSFRISANDGGYTVDAQTVVMAPGRRKTAWFLEIMRALDVQMFQDHQLIGGRVTVPADSVWPNNAGVIAPCYRDMQKPPTFNFCTCEGGFLHRNSKMEFLGDDNRPLEMVTVNGYSCADKKSQTTNWALLTEIRKDEFPNTGRVVRDFVAGVNAHNPDPRRNLLDLPLEEVVQGTHDAVLLRLIPNGAFERMRRWLQKMGTLYPGILAASSRLVLPEVKLRGDRVRTDSTLRPLDKDGAPVQNLYVGGDAGVGTNLYDAHVQGHCIGMAIAERSL